MDSNIQTFVLDYRARYFNLMFQITEGMIFLSGNGIIHRDLAARNILIGRNMEMKIADFGMARDVSDTEEEYNKESDTAVPVRWTAPESLNMGTYTTSSDVWSFGVLMWEVFSMGHQPYGGISNLEVKRLVGEGERMNQPNDCPDNIYMMMKTCWNADPKQRPDFMELLEMLIEVKRSVFAPASDYYTDDDNHHNADDYADYEMLVDCRPALREKRINWLRRAGLNVSDDNVEQLLIYMWGIGLEDTTPREVEIEIGGQYNPQ